MLYIFPKNPNAEEARLVNELIEAARGIDAAAGDEMDWAIECLSVRLQALDAWADGKKP